MFPFPAHAVTHAPVADWRCGAAPWWSPAAPTAAPCFGSGLDRPEKESKEKGGGKGATVGIEKMTNHRDF